MLSPAAEIVRRHDPDRFFTALFAPADRRETLFTLYAVNHELARAREVVSQPMLALMRLQWWREIAEGARRRHDVAGPLGEALDTGRLDAADIGAMIDGREAECEPIETEAAFRDYVRETAGGVAVAAGRALGAAGPALDILRDLGAAYGVAGILRSVPALAQQSRCVLPLDLLSRHRTDEAQVIADPAAVPDAVYARLTAIGSEWLGRRSARLPRSVLAAALPAVFARRDLARSHTEARSQHGARGGAGDHGLGDRLAVMTAALTGRV